MFYQKLCETTFVDLIETNKFSFLRFFRTLHIIVKKNYINCGNYAKYV